MKIKPLAIAVLSIVLFGGLSGCASDPYENAGACENLGESRESDGQVQVCIGVEESLKWYSSGKYFDDFKLLGKIVYGSGFDIADPEIRKLGLLDYALQYEKLDVKSEDIASYAEGNTRWDGIIEAMAVVDQEREIQDYLLDERFEARIAWERGTGSQQAAYETQQKQIEHLNGALDSAEKNYDKKLSVLTADIVNRYGITDKNRSVIFALRVLKIQDISK
jgi:hypothetical protein